jgi:lysophospholipase L1-like esterase
MRMRILAWALALAAFPLAPAWAQATSGPTIFIASDSTAAEYGPERYPQTGWGMMLKCGLSSRVRVDNRAMGGRSTRTFMEEGRLDAILAAIKPGDTVLIQFGPNDANRAKPERFVEPGTGYRDNLLHFIEVIRAKGGVPVLLTPVAQRAFEAGQVKANFAEYSAVVRAVAAETKTPLIDLETLSRAWVAQAGEEGAKRYFLHYTVEDHVAAYPKGVDDDTHFSELGARGVADLVVGGLGKLKLPVSADVLPDRPDLRRTTPLGTAACH